MRANCKRQQKVWANSWPYSVSIIIIKKKKNEGGKSAQNCLFLFDSISMSLIKPMVMVKCWENILESKNSCYYRVSSVADLYNLFNRWVTRVWQHFHLWIISRKKPQFSLVGKETKLPGKVKLRKMFRMYIFFFFFRVYFS